MRHASRAFAILMLCILPAGSIDLVELHGPQGQRFYVNPQQITTVREPLRTDMGYFGTGARCVIVMTNGKFVAVRDDCDTVRRLVGAHE